MRERGNHGIHTTYGALEQRIRCAHRLVDRYIKLAGKEQLQVLLWMLRHGGEAVQPDLLAQALGMSLDSALDALDYWVQEGLLAGQEGELSPARRVQAAQPEDGPAPLPEAGGGTAASLPPSGAC